MSIPANQECCILLTICDNLFAKNLVVSNKDGIFNTPDLFFFLQFPTHLHVQNAQQ